MSYIIDDLINAWGSQNAANAQEDQITKAMGTMGSVYGQSRADQMPWLSAGQSSLGDLMGQMRSGSFDTSVNPQNLQNDPGYQFRMQQGQQALERSAAARGGLNSGGFMKGLSRYSQGLASDEFNNAWQRNQAENQGRFGRMFQMSGMGQNAAQSLGQLGQGYGTNMAGLYGAFGNAEAARYKGLADAGAGVVRSAGNIATMGATGGLSGLTSLGGGGIPTQGYGGLKGDPYGGY